MLSNKKLPCSSNPTARKYLALRSSQDALLHTVVLAMLVCKINKPLLPDWGIVECSPLGTYSCCSPSQAPRPSRESPAEKRRDQRLTMTSDYLELASIILSQLSAYFSWIHGTNYFFKYLLIKTTGCNINSPTEISSGISDPLIFPYSNVSFQSIFLILPYPLPLSSSPETSTRRTLAVVLDGSARIRGRRTDHPA